MAVLKGIINASAVISRQDATSLQEWLGDIVSEAGGNPSYVEYFQNQSTRFTAHMRLDSLPTSKLSFLVSRIETIPLHQRIARLTRYYCTGVDTYDNTPYIKLSKIPQPNFKEFKRR